MLQFILIFFSFSSFQHKYLPLRLQHSSEYILCFIISKREVVMASWAAACNSGVSWRCCLCQSYDGCLRLCVLRQKRSCRSSAAVSDCYTKGLEVISPKLDIWSALLSLMSAECSKCWWVFSYLMCSTRLKFQPRWIELWDWLFVDSKGNLAH